MQWKHLAASSWDEYEINTHLTQRSKDILCVFACSYKTLYLSIKAIIPLWVVKRCSSIKSYSQAAVENAQKGPNKNEVTNILLIFQPEFLLHQCSKAQRSPLWFDILWLHHHIPLSLLILIEQMSQDTYSLSYMETLSQMQCSHADCSASCVT